MNKERLLELADLLETEKVAKHFDMNKYFAGPDIIRMSAYNLGDALDNCKAVACIAGWTVAKFDPKTPIKYGEVKERAQELLDITEESANALFTPDQEFVSWKSISPSDAARAVRTLAETGSVDWSWHPDYQECEDDED